MDSLDQWLNHKVSVLTHEGRHIIGTLAGFDSVTNLILEQAIERIYSVTDPVDIVPMGLIVIRGDNLVLVGELDEEKDQELDLEKIRALPIPSISM